MPTNNTTVKIYGSLQSTTGQPLSGAFLRFEPTSPGVYPNGTHASVIGKLSVVSDKLGRFEVNLPPGVTFQCTVANVVGWYEFTVPEEGPVNLVDLLAPRPKSVLWEVKGAGESWIRLSDHLSLPQMSAEVTLRLAATLTDGSYCLVDLTQVHWAMTTLFPVELAADGLTLSFERDDVPDDTLLSVLELQDPLSNLSLLFPSWTSSPNQYPWCEPEINVEAYPELHLDDSTAPLVVHESRVAYQPSSGIRAVTSAQDHLLTGQEAAAGVLRLEFPWGGQVFLPEAADIELGVLPRADVARTSKLTVVGDSITLRSSNSVVLLVDGVGVDMLPMQAGERYWLIWVWVDDLVIAGRPGVSGWAVTPQPFYTAELRALEERIDHLQTYLKLPEQPLTSPDLPDESGLYHIVDDSSALLAVNLPDLPHLQQLGWYTNVVNVSSTSLGLEVPPTHLLAVPVDREPRVMADGLVQLMYRGNGKWSAHGDLELKVGEPRQQAASAMVAGTVLRPYVDPITRSGTYVLEGTVSTVHIEPLWVDAAFGGGMATVRLLNHSTAPIPVVFNGSVVLPAGKTASVQDGGVVEAIFVAKEGTNSLSLSGDLA